MEYLIGAFVVLGILWLVILLAFCVGLLAFFRALEAEEGEQ